MRKVQKGGETPPKTKNIVVVGHGPSLVGKGLGPKIDSFDIVVRISGTDNQTPEDYGTRSDFTCTCHSYTADVLIDDMKNGVVADYQAWVFSRPTILESKIEECGIRLQGYQYDYCNYITNDWEYKFQELDPHGSKFRDRFPLISRGLAGILIAVHKFRPESVTLAGMDNLWEGTDENYLSVARGWVEKPFHDMVKERMLLDQIKEHYGFKLEKLI